MKTTKRLLVVGVATLTLFGLGGCFWIGKEAIQVGSALLFSDLAGAIGEGVSVTVSVVDMPCSGLTGLVVGLNCTGFRFNPAQLQVTDVVGVNGFVILAKHIDNTAGEVRFVAVNPNEGIVTGDVAQIVGTRLGAGDAGLAVSKDNLQLAGACGDLITTYTVGTGAGVPYFVKGGN